MIHQLRVGLVHQPKILTPGELLELLGKPVGWCSGCWAPYPQDVQLPMQCSRCGALMFLVVTLTRQQILQGKIEAILRPLEERVVEEIQQLEDAWFLRHIEKLFPVVLRGGP